jgi:type I site-specific restriction-modification system R (restriction) subunit
MPPQPVRRYARGNHPVVQALSPIRIHRHADLRRQRRHGRQPEAAHHGAGVRRQAAHLHHRRRDQRQERVAVPHRLHQHHQDRAERARQAGVGHRHGTALLAPERITQIAAYIREHFDQKTKRSASYRHGGKRLNGFNSLFATAIDAAKRYYTEFASQQKDIPPAQRLKIGLIYSFAANEDVDGLLEEEEFETEGLDQGSRDFLDAAIKDYNDLFATNFDTSADKFQNYYKDLSQRLKNRELDLVIVSTCS